MAFRGAVRNSNKAFQTSTKAYFRLVMSERQANIQSQKISDLHEQDTDCSKIGIFLLAEKPAATNSFAIGNPSTYSTELRKYIKILEIGK